MIRDQAKGGSRGGQLGTRDLTVANIGPGIDFPFRVRRDRRDRGGRGTIDDPGRGDRRRVPGGGGGRITRAESSAASFITYVESGPGGRAAVVTALLVTVGNTVAMAGVFTMSGGMVTMTLDHYTSLHRPWEPLAVLLTVAAVWVSAKGVKLSASAVGVALVAQVAVMLTVCFVALIDRRHHLFGGAVVLDASARRVDRLIERLSARPVHVHRLGERSGARGRKPRSRADLPRALYLSIAIGTVLFVLFAYATVTGFHYDVSSIGRTSVPFLTIADHDLGGPAILAWIAGIVSVLAALMAGSSSQARMLYDGDGPVCSPHASDAC